MCVLARQLTFSLLSAVDVQHPRPEHATGPAADSERAPDQHERPAAGEFSPSPMEANHGARMTCFKSLPTHARELPGRTNKGCDRHVAERGHANLMPLMQILMWRHTAASEVNEKTIWGQSDINT